MRYQLPDGTSIEMDMDEYLSMSDTEFNIKVMGKQHFSTFEVYEPIRKNADDIEVKRTLNDIIRDMSEDI